MATQDHSVNPELERFSAERMGATTYEVESSHVPMLSHPDIVLDAIRNLVRARSQQPLSRSANGMCRVGRPAMTLGRA